MQYNDYIMEIIEKFNKAKNDQTMVIFKNCFTSNATWEDIIKEIDFLSKTEVDGAFKDMDNNIYNNRQNSILSQSNNFGYLQGVINAPFEKKYLDNLNNLIIDIYKKILKNDNYLSKAQIFINLVGENYKTYKHRDNWDVIFLQLLGDIIINIYKKEDELSEFDSKILLQSEKISPGDLVLIPKGSVHEIVVLTPRVSLSIGLNGKTTTSFSYEED